MKELQLNGIVITVGWEPPIWNGWKYEVLHVFWNANTPLKIEDVWDKLTPGIRPTDRWEVPFFLEDLEARGIVRLGKNGYTSAVTAEEFYNALIDAMTISLQEACKKEAEQK